MSPVCLPNSASSDKYAEQEAAVIGWGAIKEGRKTDPIRLNIQLEQLGAN